MGMTSSLCTNFNIWKSNPGKQRVFLFVCCSWNFKKLVKMTSQNSLTKMQVKSATIKLKKI